MGVLVALRGGEPPSGESTVAAGGAGRFDGTPNKKQGFMVGVCVFGDLCLAGELETILKNAHGGPLKHGLSRLCEPEDVAVANIECALSEHGSPVPGKWATLRASPDCVEWLRRLDVANLGNNHISDYGDSTARETRNLLEGVGIRTVGYGADLGSAIGPCIIKRSGSRIAFLSFSCLSTNGRNYATDTSPGVAPLSSELLRHSLTQIRPHVDAIFVLVHWGLEQKRFPTVDQVRIGHRAIDWGADAVIGCHGHVIQPIEEYRGKWIAYGLGNFLFGDVAYTGVRADGEPFTGLVQQLPENLESLVVRFSVSPHGVGKDVTLDRVSPVLVRERVSPVLASEKELTFDFPGTLQQQRQLVGAFPSLWDGNSEIAYRTVVGPGGHLCHFYSSPEPIDEIVRKPATSHPEPILARVWRVVRARLCSALLSRHTAR